MIRQTEISFRDKLSAALNSSNDGSKGKFRASDDRSLVALETDADAIKAFLTQGVSSPATRRMYEKEAERLQFWAVLCLNKAVSDMDMNDFDQYVKFLRQPDISWVARQKFPKTSVSWRPFVRAIEHEKPVALSENALLAAISALNTMMTWFVDSGYLTGNPLGLVRKKMKHSVRHDAHEDKVDRFLNDEIVSNIKTVIMAMPKEDKRQEMHYERSRFIFSMFIMLGPRISELSRSLMMDFRKEDSGWFWKVIGKGSKGAKVAVPDDMLDALAHWRKILKLPSALPIGNDTTPVIPVLNKSGTPLLHKPGMSARRINEILKDIFKMTIAHIRTSQSGQSSEEKILYLSHASAHWLRHTSITQKVKAGMQREMVQMDARHTDARTTDRYIHDQEPLRIENAKKHKMKW